ncbi:MAG TPA: GMC family oxidoreductase N-terminal domain-containing protein [Gemmatimonadaceae bacterium]|nr:GMC family oxidoreductase N-terminal domain-containing protein [Gemmatimonadaceae bacterium]
MSKSGHHEKAFDYVVIGAGSAGCVVASRLSCRAGVSVALLEAGGPHRRVLDVPLVSLWAWLRRPSAYCWQDWTVPQPGLGGRRVWWPAGRIVGGSSAINAMMYNRGHPRSYDRWNGDETGEVDWRFDALLPYFRRAEDQERGESHFHGVGGPLAVSDTRYPHELGRAFISACEEFGIAPTSDFNGTNPEGAGFSQLMQRNGVRSSTASYLTEIASGPRLTMVLGARATRVLLEKGRAVGVEYTSRDGLHVVRATREVILCAGTVRSPHLLLLSGVGPGEHLRRLGIDVVAESPGVGVNLQDHVRVPLVRYLSGRRPTRISSLLRASLEYLWSRRGLLTSNVADAAAIVRLDAANPVPQVRIVFRWRVKPAERAMLVDFEVVLIDPRSHGQLSICTSDPADGPAIDPGYLREPDDTRNLQRGLELAREIAQTASCRRAGVGDEFLPGARDITAHIREQAETAFHPVGTCRLGSDGGAVVDTRLRVRGVSGLRVVDASVMPTTVAGNAEAAVVAIAERASDLILDC